VFKKASMLGLRQASEGEATADEGDERLGGTGQTCVLRAQAPVSAQPRAGARHDPAAREPMNPRRVAAIGPEVCSVACEVTPVGIDHVERQAIAQCRLALQRARSAWVRPEPLQAGTAPAHCVEPQSPAGAIGPMGGGDDHAEHDARGVDQDVALASGACVWEHR
jgi:hypothetical protein